MAIFEKEVRKESVQELVKAEKAEMPHHSELFMDVYDEPLPTLLEQQAELKAHMERNPAHFK